MTMIGACDANASKHYLLIATLLLWLTTGGCMVESAELTQSASSIAPLTAYKPGLSTDNYILVCWEQRGFAREKDMVRQAVENTWMRYSRLVFADWGDCAVSTVGIHITLENGTDPSPGPGSKYGWPRAQEGLVGTGRRNRDIRLTFDFQARAAEFPECVVDPTALDACIRSSSVHEFGHALGFIHEQERQYASVQCKNKLGDDYPSLALGAEEEWDLGPFDHDSIMAACSLQRDSAQLLTPNDIFYLQQAYSRKASSVFVAFDGRCLDFGAGDTDGSGAQTYECLGGTQFSPAEIAAPNQHLQFDTVTGQIGMVGSERVLTVPRDDASIGNQLRLGDPTSASGQMWKLRNVLLRSMGEMCVAPVTPGAPMFSELALVKCSTQKPRPELLFNVEANGSLVHNQSGLCLHATGMAGTRLQLQPCADAPSQSWVPFEKGAFKAYRGTQNLCIDIGLPRNDLDRFFGSDDYNRLQVYTCNGQPNQMFSIAGPIQGLGGKCVEVASSARNNGTAVRLWECSGQENQVWEYYW